MWPRPAPLSNTVPFPVPFPYPTLLLKPPSPLLLYLPSSPPTGAPPASSRRFPCLLPAFHCFPFLVPRPVLPLPLPPPAAVSPFPFASRGCFKTRDKTNKITSENRSLNQDLLWEVAFRMRPRCENDAVKCVKTCVISSVAWKRRICLWPSCIAGDPCRNQLNSSSIIHQQRFWFRPTP